MGLRNKTEATVKSTDTGSPTESVAKLQKRVTELEARMDKIVASISAATGRSPEEE